MGLHLAQGAKACSQEGHEGWLSSQLTSKASLWVEASLHGPVLAQRPTGALRSDQNKPPCAGARCWPICGKCQPCCRAQGRAIASQGRHNCDALMVPDAPKAKVRLAQRSLVVFGGREKQPQNLFCSSRMSFSLVSDCKEMGGLLSSPTRKYFWGVETIMLQ